MNLKRRMGACLPVIVGALLGLSACITPQAPPTGASGHEAVQELSLAGTWRYQKGGLGPENLADPALSHAHWPQMTLPANWYLRGVDHAGVMWFRKTVPLTLPEGALARLHFSGVDYACDVWVNGTWVGHHQGYFAPFAFPVTAQLQAGDNLIAVRVNSPNEEYGRQWSLHKRLIKGVLNHHDTRPGGAWSPRGQEKNSGGIWAPVTLRITRKAAITGLAVTPELTEDGAEAHVALALATPDMAGETVQVTLRVTPQKGDGTPAQAVTTQAEFPCLGETLSGHLTLQVPGARLWWPWELGTPALYRVEATVRQGDTVLDTHADLFGFREIKRDPATGTWLINGKRIFLRGTNYIASQWLSEMDRTRLAADLDLMKQAHINAIRVHAHVEPKDFYRLCDEMGLLVWQDFPLQWGYADDKDFSDEAVRQAKEMVDSLYNHPGIFTWCGHNEPPWDATWMKWKYPGYVPGQNQELDRVVMQALVKADASRPAQENSPTADHPWLGWYSGNWRDYARPTDRSLITEFGAQALPKQSTLETFLPPEAIWPQTREAWDLWAYHNFQEKESFEIAGIPRGESIDELIRATQGYQARLTQLAVESYRRQRFAPVAGIFQFMFVEGWPSMNWGIVDYLRHPKPGYMALQQAYQPLLPSIEMAKETWAEGETVTARLWVINDLPEEIPEATLTLALMKGDRQLAKARETFAIEADNARQATGISRAGLPQGAYHIEAAILGPDGKVLASNRLEFRVEKGETP
ncbi:glycoside hydrolase family 2 protein [Desulfoluna spongiiphila]|uniref:Beta-mannosidase n=1 Tax=Desulfoluna spongiiphila TaxID=419481 RepID=A0A1G5B1X1_9BACT|nr:sugar-binding domain-containing protein [Desulfoluna spongiiphila]SCX84177.1 beta-mannosidase [Desulfoluna spongiiphila]